MFRALWPTGDMLRQATRQFWSGHIRLENLIWAATLNIAILYVFGMIPLTGIEILHDHRLLALVGRPSLGRAVVRVLRRRMSAYLLMAVVWCRASWPSGRSISS